MNSTRDWIVIISVMIGALVLGGVEARGGLLGTQTDFVGLTIVGACIIVAFLVLFLPKREKRSNYTMARKKSTSPRHL